MFNADKVEKNELRKTFLTSFSVLIVHTHFFVQAKGEYNITKQGSKLMHQTMICSS